MFSTLALSSINCDVNTHNVKPILSQFPTMFNKNSTKCVTILPIDPLNMHRYHNTTCENIGTNSRHIVHDEWKDIFHLSQFVSNTLLVDMVELHGRSFVDLLKNISTSDQLTEPSMWCLKQNTSVPFRCEHPTSVACVSGMIYYCFCVKIFLQTSHFAPHHNGDLKFSNIAETIWFTLQMEIK